MLGFGILSLALATFLIWVSLQGGNFINAGNWSDATKQVMEKLREWFGASPVPSVAGNGA